MSNRRHIYVAILCWALVFLGLYVISQYNYLLFHGLAEMFSIVVACGIFMVAWNSRQHADNNYLLFIGVAYLFVGGMDMLHTLGYKGMGVFSGYDTNLPAQLWIAARYMESLSLLLAPLFIGRKIRVRLVILGYVLAFSLALGAIFYWDIFPDCFIEGDGLTLFKKISEYIISLIFLGAIPLMLRKRREFDTGVLRLLTASIAVSVSSELAFTLYVSAYGLPNAVGHFLKVISFVLIYRAIIETGFEHPYRILFRNLKKSEEKHRTYIENAPDGIFITDSNGRYMDVNQAACLMTGYSREELLSMSIRELASPDSFPEALEAFNEVKETGKIQIELVLRRKDGTEFHSSLEAVALSDNRFMAFCSDIAERKQAEDALRESEERFRSLFETMVSGFSLLEMVYDEDGKPVDCRYVAVNPSHQRHSGLNPSEIIGKGAKEIFGLKDEWIEKYDHVAKTGESIMIEDYVEGLGRWFSVVAYRPKPGFVAVTLQNITERKRAEAALRESEKRLSQVVDGSSIPTFVIDNRHIIIYWNKACEKLTGISASEMIGTKKQWAAYYSVKRPVMADLVVDDVLEEEMTRYYSGRFRKSAIMQGAYEAEDFFPHLGKSGKWLFFTAVPLREIEGKIIGAIETLQDITSRKRMEEELQKMEKLESIGILAGGIAHDLNNFLTGIVGNISLAMMYEDPREKDKRLAEADKACMLIKNLTQQLLTFSRGGAPVLQTANIAELLRNSATLPLSGSNVGCELSIPDGLWPVEVDEGQMNQVINNLVINAKQAMPGGGVIRIRAENTNIDEESNLPLEAGAYIRVSAEDEGIGISQEHIHRIFDPFYTTKQTGSGLGLATSYSIIEKHKGHIAVESRIGVGTTFHIYLPASPEGVLMEAEEEKKPIMGEGRILVMDDEKHVRDTAASMLSSIGYEVITAINGAEAIEIYKEAMSSDSPIDAIIIDLTIPGGMGGEETIQKLIEIDPEVKAIVSSGYSSDPILANFREYGFTGFIAKPYKIQELSEILHGVITGADWE